MLSMLSIGVKIQIGCQTQRIEYLPECYPKNSCEDQPKRSDSMMRKFGR